MSPTTIALLSFATGVLATCAWRILLASCGHKNTHVKMIVALRTSQDWSAGELDEDEAVSRIYNAFRNPTK